MSERKRGLVLPPYIPEYRAWDKRKEKMHPVSLIQFGSEYYQGIQDDNFNYYPLKDIVLMQWSGLVDIEGRKIFDQDIAKVPTAIVSASRLYRTVTVGYRVKDGCWTLENEDFVKTVQRYRRLTEKTVKQDKIQVIGNMFESPQLNDLLTTEDGIVVTDENWDEITKGTPWYANNKR